jgi:hypothetical protein
VVNAALDNQGTVLAQGVDNQIDGDYTSEPGSTLRVSGDPANFNTTLTMANDFTNHGLIELTSSNGSHDASLNLGLRFNGGDTRTLTNAPDGTISAVAGTGGNRTLNANVENQGTISVASGTTLTIFYGGLNNLNNGTLSGGTYDVAGTFQFFNGAITTNDASLTLDGPAARVVDMSFGRNALTGLSSNTANGTLVFVDGATLTLPSFTNNGWFEVDDTSHVTVNGAYNDEGTTALGGGTLTASLIQIDIGALVTGTGTLDGDVYNKAGTLVVGSVGTPGILKVTGNYTQGSGADLYLEIGGTNAGTDFGLLQVGKKATLDGTLSVVLINGYTPPSGTRFQVMTYASESGEFATLDQDGTSFTPEYDATGLTLVAN